jgi:hypothetical protein
MDLTMPTLRYAGVPVKLKRCNMFQSGVGNLGIHRDRGRLALFLYLVITLVKEKLSLT